MNDPTMECHYFNAGRCGSCVLIRTPYVLQLEEKQLRCEELLPGVSSTVWRPPVASAERGYRNRVKLVVGSGPDGSGITLGILDSEQHGVDLRECAIQAPGIAAIIPTLASLLEDSGLPSYSVPERRGELKFVHITVSPDGELMIRFVGRTQFTLDVLRSRLPHIRAAIPQASVISVNLLPEHRAVLEGEREEILWGSTLQMALNGADGVKLHLLPQSFFQTNTEVSRALYERVASWAVSLQPRSVWDLYCGVGGFALHCAVALAESGTPVLATSRVLGVELGVAAVASAQQSAEDAGVEAEFIASDATAFALGAAPEMLPELLIVNPPRRGIGETLAQWLEDSGVPHLVYSSCNPESLARDLARMPAYRVSDAQTFDMFPHTRHVEVAVLLSRVAS